MRRADRAVDIFNKGFNCAQAVLSVFASDLGMDEKKALKVACAFGEPTFDHKSKVDACSCPF